MNAKRFWYNAMSKSAVQASLPRITQKMKERWSSFIEKHIVEFDKRDLKARTLKALDKEVKRLFGKHCFLLTPAMFSYIKIPGTFMMVLKRRWVFDILSDDYHMEGTMGMIKSARHVQHRDGTEDAVARIYNSKDGDINVTVKTHMPYLIFVKRASIMRQLIFW
jgi:hypothetical protein